MDAELIQHGVKEIIPWAEFRLVESQDEFISALGQFKPNLIISDYLLPDFTGLEALRLALEYDPEIPFLIITGATNEETAVECIRAGAWNYILKDNLMRLGPVLEGVAERRRLREAHRQDLEQLREREARYRSLFRNNHAVMLIVNPEDDRIVDANSAAASYYGWSREQLLAKRITDINTMGHEEVKREMGRAIDEQRKVFHFRHRLADGTIREVEVFAGPIQIEKRRLLYSIVHDITERVKAQRELVKAHEELKAAQSFLVQQEKMASIGVLAAGVAHEINNPMGYIGSNLNTLQKYATKLNDHCQRQEERIKELMEADASGATPYRRDPGVDRILSDLPELVKECLEGVERVTQIVLSLKSFSRVDQTSRDMADINACLEDTLRVVFNELKYNANVHKDFGELPPLWCYPQKLNQVFANLLVNASQSHEKFGDIWVRTWFADDEIHISVRDSGSGVASEHLERLFEPFFTTKEVGKGTGLGLSISYDIVTRKHGGRLEVESEPGKGSTFTVHLPLLQPSDDEAQQ